MFYSVTMLMITMSIIVSVFVIRLAHRELGKNSASCFLGKNAYTRVFRTMLCLNHVNVPRRLDEELHDERLNPEVIDVDAESVVTNVNDDDADEYKQRFVLASGIDRFFCVIYLFVYLILICVYSI